MSDGIYISCDCGVSAKCLHSGAAHIYRTLPWRKLHAEIAHIRHLASQGALPLDAQTIGHLAFLDGRADEFDVSVARSYLDVFEVVKTYLATEDIPTLYRNGDAHIWRYPERPINSQHYVFGSHIILLDQSSLIVLGPIGALVREPPTFWKERPPPGPRSKHLAVDAQSRSTRAAVAAVLEKSDLWRTMPQKKVRRLTKTSLDGYQTDDGGWISERFGADETVEFRLESFDRLPNILSNIEDVCRQSVTLSRPMRLDH